MKNVKYFVMIKYCKVLTQEQKYIGNNVKKKNIVRTNSQKSRSGKQNIEKKTKRLIIK